MPAMPLIEPLSFIKGDHGTIDFYFRKAGWKILKRNPNERFVEIFHQISVSVLSHLWAVRRGSAVASYGI